MGTFNTGIYPASTGIPFGKRDAAFNAIVNDLTVLGAFNLNHGGSLVPQPFSPTPIFNGSLATIFDFPLTGNVTSSSFVDGIAGGEYCWLIRQAGGFDFAWPANAHNGMQVSAAAGSVSLECFLYDGAALYGMMGTIYP